LEKVSEKVALMLLVWTGRSVEDCLVQADKILELISKVGYIHQDSEVFVKSAYEYSKEAGWREG